MAHSRWSRGGGGTGIASVMKGVDPRVRIVACQPARDDAMHQCVLASKVVELTNAGPTLSEATAGPTPLPLNDRFFKGNPFLCPAVNKLPE